MQLLTCFINCQNISNFLTILLYVNLWGRKLEPRNSIIGLFPSLSCWIVNQYFGWSYLCICSLTVMFFHKVWLCGAIVIMSYLYTGYMQVDHLVFHTVGLFSSCLVFIQGFCSLIIMFFIQWGYALAVISVVIVLYIYIGQANPGVFPGMFEAV